MMRYLSLGEILRLHESVISLAGGSTGIRDLGILESAVAQRHATFDGKHLYPDLLSKASALGFAVATGHPFVDGNKRIAHAAMEVFMMINGFEIQADIDEQEKMMFGLASGQTSRANLQKWLTEHAAPYREQR